MNFKSFFNEFPTEESCKLHFKNYRDKTGVTCKKCGCKNHYWLSTTWYYKCKECGFRTSLKSGTVMENTKLPYSYWFMAFMMITGTKKSFSALEIQRQTEHKFYEPIWAMMHKIRIVMGKRDEKYQLSGNVEIDEGFFVTTPAIEKDANGNKLPKLKMKPGKGSPRSATILVMTESKLNLENRDKYRPNRSVKHIRMVHIEDTKAISVLPEIEKAVNRNAEAITDGANHYSRLNKVIKSHQKVVLTTEQADKILPWVHKTISNSKRILVGVHHSIGQFYIQNYLNEFCFKFNRRYSGIDLFDRLLSASVQYQWN